MISFNIILIECDLSENDEETVHKSLKNIPLEIPIGRYHRYHRDPAQ